MAPAGWVRHPPVERVGLGTAGCIWVASATGRGRSHGTSRSPRICAVGPGCRNRRRAGLRACRASAPRLGGRRGEVPGPRGFPERGAATGASRVGPGAPAAAVMEGVIFPITIRYIKMHPAPANMPEKQNIDQIIRLFRELCMHRAADPQSRRAIQGSATQRAASSPDSRRTSGAQAAGPRKRGHSPWLPPGRRIRGRPPPPAAPAAAAPAGQGPRPPAPRSRAAPPAPAAGPARSGSAPPAAAGCGRACATPSATSRSSRRAAMASGAASMAQGILPGDHRLPRPGRGGKGEQPGRRCRQPRCQRHPGELRGAARRRRAEDDRPRQPAQRREIGDRAGMPDQHQRLLRHRGEEIQPLQTAGRRRPPPRGPAAAASPRCRSPGRPAAAAASARAATSPPSPGRFSTRDRCTRPVPFEEGREGPRPRDPARCPPRRRPAASPPGRRPAGRPPLGQAGAGAAASRAPPSARAPARAQTPAGARALPPWAAGGVASGPPRRSRFSPV